MAYKSILTVLTRAADATLAVDGAARMALEQDAHLDILVLGVDRTQVGYSYIGSGAVLMQVSLDRAEAEAFAAADPYAKAGLFSDVTIREWRKVIG